MSKTQEECLEILEQIRWGGQPRCPYCDSTNASPFKRERRYHCNTCFTSYSVTVGTLFHRTHVEMPKWFRVIQLFISQPNRFSVRQLASEICVNKNTASYMLSRLRKAVDEEPELLEQLYKAIDEPRF
ncbi:transposase [Nostocaceae cyanobacterium CENA357]|uniref:Transposase n=1 Tax=Atlanticothrix silvestris CENA357 TaxID=1725252 RepID=A0A8J7HBJ2_9CYAN|nr:transposase [Atlanticothrix silvestris]MBH8552687.1 transposase [Atlanticothrix silvestris CENA357]